MKEGNMSRSRQMCMLHISAPTLWRRGEQSGMPSVHETVHAYVEDSHQVDLIVRHANAFGLKRVPEESSWPRALLRVTRVPDLEHAAIARRVYKRPVPSAAVRWLAEWALSISLWFALTFAHSVEGLVRSRKARYGGIYVDNESVALGGYLGGRMIKCSTAIRLYWSCLFIAEEPLSSLAASTVRRA